MHVHALQLALAAGGGMAEDDLVAGLEVGWRLIHSGPYFTPNKDRDCGKGAASRAAFTYVGSFTVMPPLDQILLAEKSQGGYGNLRTLKRY